MIGLFRLRCSAAAAASVPRDVRSQILTDAVALAERTAPDPGTTAIYDVPTYQLKVIVQVAERCIWLVTKDEADRSGLPDRPTMHTEN